MGMGHGDESGDRDRSRYGNRSRSRYGNRSRSRNRNGSRNGSPASKPGFSDGVPFFAENATSKHFEAD